MFNLGHEVVGLVERIKNRLGVYLLLDCSSSMEGEPIEAVRQGIRALLFELRQDYQVSSCAWVSAFCFHSVAQRMSPLLPLQAFREPKIVAGGTSLFGEALQLLLECLVSENAGGEGWRPLVFVFTDGRFCDDWQENAQKLCQQALVIACCAGSQGAKQSLHKLTDRLLMLNTVAPGDFAAHFELIGS